MLLVEDHGDGHSSQVYVFSFKANPQAAIAVTTKFKSPDNGYDIKWYFVRWDEKGSNLVLRKDQILHSRDADGKLDMSKKLGQKSQNYDFPIILK